MEISDFLQIEQKYDLYHLGIEGVSVWMYYRFKFWNYRICKNLLSLSDTVSKKSKRKSLGTQLKSIFHIIARGNTRRICKADILFYAHPRRIRADGYYECIYTDCLLERYPGSMVLEEPYQNRHFTPIKPEHVYYTDLLQIKAALYSRMQRHLKTPGYRKAYRQVRKAFERPLGEIGSAYQFEASSDSIFSELAELVLEIRMLKKGIRRVFDRVGPRMVVEVVYYNKRCMVLNELAKEKGIPAVELQHGTMHAAHAAYQFANGCGKVSQFPDYVFVFAEYWKKCAHIPIGDECVKVTGYPYFERQLRQYRKAGSGKEKLINIIFVSQGTIGRELGRLAGELCDLLDVDKYHIIYKLHPGEYIGWRERSPELLKENIEVIDNPEHSIYEFFSRCSIQVGAYSTAIYEGLGFGLATYIYEVGHADTMAELCRQGHAVYVRSAEELYANIMDEKAVERRGGKEFWKADALDHICGEIDRLLGNVKQ